MLKSIGPLNDERLTVLVKYILCLHLYALSGILLASGQECGVERWSIKTLSDTDTAFIHFNNVVRSSVHDQVNMEAPFGRLNDRLASETVVYEIECFVIGYKKEPDRDIHVIVEDINTDETMVIEIMSPDCPEVKNTSRHKLAIELYQWFTENIGVPRTSFTFLKDHKRINLTGVGFWDYLHGQKGMANNGREIHPVLSMKIITK